MPKPPLANTKVAMDPKLLEAPIITNPTSSTSLELISQVKDQVKTNIHKEDYDVTEFYHTTGFSQWLARHQKFEHLTLLVICLNALWIWIDTDLNPGAMLITSPPVFQIAEHAFCCYFSYEWIIRFLAFRRKRDGLRDFWFVFDSLLVWTMIFETWVMSIVFLAAMDSGSGGMGNASILRIARLLRLTRMARMARLLRALPELLILIKGMVAALRSVCFALGLLGLILYVFGVAFTQLCEDTSLEGQFETVIRSMHTLLVYGALMDEVSSLITDIEEENIFLLLIFYMFLLLASLTVMNMLVGVITEMVLKVGATERAQATKSFVTDKLMELMMTGADENNDNRISKEEFIWMLHNKRANRVLHEVGVDVIGLLDFADTIFEPTPDEGQVGEKQLTVKEFMKVILDLRGDQGAKVRDIMELRKYIRACFARLEQKFSDFQRVECSDISKEVEKAALPTAPLAQLHDWMWPGSQACSPKPSLGSQKAKTSQEMEPMSVKSLQEQVNASLTKVQITHERELASLHAENLKLLDKLSDLGAVAGKSMGAVLKVAASVPAPSKEKQTSLDLPFTVAEQPQVQSIGGIPRRGPMNAAADSRVGSRESEAADPQVRSRESAKQEKSSSRLSMEIMMEEARRSLAGNVGT